MSHLTVQLDLSRSSTAELFSMYRGILRELRSRGIVRTGNAPTGDYAEYLVARQLDGELAGSSERGFDVRTADGTRFQVKSRMVDGGAGKRQLSPFRSWEFDYAAIVLFDDDYSVLRAVLLPRHVVQHRSTHIAHVNGHVVQATDDLLGHAQAQDITAQLRAVAGGVTPGREIVEVADDAALSEVREMVMADITGAPASGLIGPRVTAPPDPGVADRVEKERQAGRFHDGCADRVGEYFNTSFRRLSRGAYESVDGSITITCFASKRYETGVREHYWFGFHPYQQERLEAAGDAAYLAFGCGSDELVFLVPYQEFKAWIEGLNTTEKDGRRHWHVHIKATEAGHELRRSKGFDDIDMEPYRLA